MSRRRKTDKGLPQMDLKPHRLQTFRDQKKKKKKKQHQKPPKKQPPTKTKEKTRNKKKKKHRGVGNQKKTSLAEKIHSSETPLLDHSSREAGKAKRKPTREGSYH